jgi:hypothetical protein
LLRCYLEVAAEPVERIQVNLHPLGVVEVVDRLVGQPGVRVGVRMPFELDALLAAVAGALAG